MEGIALALLIVLLLKIALLLLEVIGNGVSSLAGVEILDCVSDPLRLGEEGSIFFTFL